MERAYQSRFLPFARAKPPFGVREKGVGVEGLKESKTLTMPSD
jgi:hypothetical protein